jgi:serine/threonine protein kinase
VYWDGISTIVRDGEILKGSRGEYKIVKLINDGASIVYQAKRDDGKDIFLKQFKDPTSQNEEWSEFIKFQHSVLRTLMQLPPHTVEINYEYFECEGVHFHAKAFENGFDLSVLIWEEKPKMPVRFTLVLEMLSILDSVHKKGVVHSDLKPQQFFVIEDSSKEQGYRIKLIDFDHCVIPSLSLYSPAGTDGWMSPEHVKNSKIQESSDVFTIGQIIYTLITGGRQPYGHSLENDTYATDIMSKKGYVSLDTLYKGALPKEISDIIDLMLEPEASKRPSVEKVHAIIQKSLNSKPEPKPEDKPKHLTLESNGRSRLVVQTQIFTRELIKSSFGNHSEIYNKQFEIMKDNSGSWYVKGYNVPSEAKDAKGKVYKFYKTLCNGTDVTNKYVALSDSDIIKVGSTEFLVRFK